MSVCSTLFIPNGATHKKAVGLGETNQETVAFDAMCMGSSPSEHFLRRKKYPVPKLRERYSSGATHMLQHDVVRRASKENHPSSTVRCHVAVTSSHGQMSHRGGGRSARRGEPPKLFKSLLQSRTNGRGSELGTSADRRHRQTTLRAQSLGSRQWQGHRCNPTNLLYQR
jgi:hypothetical protein